MAVTEAQVATLRAHLAGDYDRYQELWATLDKEEARSGYAALVTAACFEAVDRFFSAGKGAPDVVTYVAELRVRLDRTADLIDPMAAEQIINFMLGHGSIDDMEDTRRHATELAVLTGVASDLHLDDKTLDELMTEARDLADEWIAEQH